MLGILAAWGVHINRLSQPDEAASDSLAISQRSKLMLLQESSILGRILNCEQAKSGYPPDRQPRAFPGDHLDDAS